MIKRKLYRLIPAFLTLVVGGSVAGQVDSYAVATIAPVGVTVPPIVLEESILHALLVELATGADRSAIGQRLGVNAAELDRLYELVEMEGLGRPTPEGGWRSMALALDAEGAARLTSTADSLSSAIADTLAARWSVLDSLVARLPVTGRLPLDQTGFVLLGGYLLGLFQADSFWQAGLAPADRPYAFRVYRLDPDESPAGHRIDDLGRSGWRLNRFTPSVEPYGFQLLSDLSDPVIAGLVDPRDRGAGERFTIEMAEAYRLWYLMDVPPDPPTVRLLTYLEAVDEEGRLRVPLISEDDLEPMKAIARQIGFALWPVLQEALPSIASMAADLGYEDPAMLGEIALWTWERAAQLAIWDLVEEGLLLPPSNSRGQALLVPRYP
jgi:hypothetical protein